MINDIPPPLSAVPASISITISNNTPTQAGRPDRQCIISKKFKAGEGMADVRYVA